MPKHQGQSNSLTAVPLPFRWTDFDAYLFDIDGTLLNTRDPTHFFAFRNALRDHLGIDALIDGVPIHGNTDIGILRAVAERAGVPADAVLGKMPALLEQMCAEVRSKAAEITAEACPAIPELIARLSAGGKLLGVASGNVETIGWLKLEACGLRQWFAFGAFCGHSETREEIFREGMAKARVLAGPNIAVCMIGDTPSDIRAARAVGMPIVAVSTGVFPYEELAALAPHLCVRSCDALLRDLKV